MTKLFKKKQQNFKKKIASAHNEFFKTKQIGKFLSFSSWLITKMFQEAKFFGGFVSYFKLQLWHKVINRFLKPYYKAFMKVDTKQNTRQIEC